MRQRPLPTPDAIGVYTFPDDLANAHRAHQDRLTARRRAGDATVMEVTAPYGGHPYLIEQRHPVGQPVVVIEPHHDDLVLSASGLFLTRPRPLTVVTVFTRSTSAHRSALAEHPGEEAVSTLRAGESRQALLPVGADQRLLGYRDATPPYRPYDPAVLKLVTADLERVLAEVGAAELLAPVGVTRHPDHLLVHEAARRVGCRWFWEDVAFWQTYGLSTDDRQLFQERVGDSLVPELVDITSVLLDKLTLLYLHASQLQPLHAMYRPLRHAWTTAAALRPADPVCFAERFYRRETQ
ncbi:PIG-L family deacetylase [Streptosporangium sp. NPDC005286]|uniref:PIG-L deacetylase family protein n=1 Tax=Streptosporangium sp. NPDC005286 TaxID=3154463 RepID=UPI0033A0D0FE